MDDAGKLGVDGGPVDAVTEVGGVEVIFTVCRPGDEAVQAYCIFLKKRT